MKYSLSTVRARGGFSLVESVLALGIVSFALVSVLGLIPIALSTFRSALKIHMESQIVQTLCRDSFLQNQNLENSKTYFYNEQGAEIAAGSPEIIYKAVVTQKPLEISSARLLSTGVAKIVIVEITNISNPAVTNSFPIVVANSPL